VTEVVTSKSFRAAKRRELPSSCVATSALGARPNSEAGPKGGGQDARNKRKVNQREGHPAWRLLGIRQLLLHCSTSVIHALAMPGKSVSCVPQWA